MDRKDTGAKRVGQEFKIAFLGNKRKAGYLKNQKVRMPSRNYIHCLVLLSMPKDNMSLESDIGALDRACALRIAKPLSTRRHPTILTTFPSTNLLSSHLMSTLTHYCSCNLYIT
jgi:hypothetical protein